MTNEEFGATVIEIDFEAIYSGEMLAEGNNSEQTDEWFPLAV
ncbi:MAG: hypothetical protein ACRDUS_07110 [Mycobacterium sp.]